MLNKAIKLRFLNISDKADFNLPKRKLNLDVKENPEKIRRGKITDNKIITPRVTDKTCCIPKRIKLCPKNPKMAPKTE